MTSLVDELPESKVAHLHHKALKKLPEVTLALWIMKICATTLGETAGDMFSMTLNIGYFLTTIALFSIFLVSLVAQLRSKQYNPLLYWTVILTTSTAGTTISDFMNRDQGWFLGVGAPRSRGGLLGRSLRGVAAVRIVLSQDEQVRVWELWRQGLSLRSVAREMGRGQQDVGRYVRWMGGVRPAARRRGARCLSAGEREEISRGLAAGLSFRTIGAGLGRCHTTIAREVARNGGRDGYRAGAADAAAWERARRPKPAKLERCPELRAVVAEKLGARWSPQQISGWLRRRYSGQEAMQISHETIYLSLYVQARGELGRELTRYLRSGRSTRVPRGCGESAGGQGKLRDKVHIRERPVEAADRAVPGHWEGDLLLGRRPTAIATLVERSSRFVQLIALPDGTRAEPVRQALTASITSLPEQLQRSLTWDQGKEMAEHAQFTIDSGVQVYFCDPRSPWQRGSNENTNGLLRQYFPKRTPIPTDQEQLDQIAAELNSRPRRTLGYMTPAEKLAELTAP